MILSAGTLMLALTACSNTTVAETSGDVRSGNDHAAVVVEQESEEDVPYMEAVLEMEAGTQEDTKEKLEGEVVVEDGAMIPESITEQQAVMEPETAEPGTEHKAATEPVAVGPGSEQKAAAEPVAVEPGSEQKAVTEPVAAGLRSDKKVPAESGTAQPDSAKQPAEEPISKQQTVTPGYAVSEEKAPTDNSGNCIQIYSSNNCIENGSSCIRIGSSGDCDLVSGLCQTYGINNCGTNNYCNSNNCEDSSNCNGNNNCGSNGNCNGSNNCANSSKCNGNSCINGNHVCGYTYCIR